MPPGELYKLEKPDGARINRENISSALDFTKKELRDYIVDSNSPYYYWTDFKHKKKSYGTLSIEESWTLIRQFRNFSSRHTYLKAKTGEPFVWNESSSLNERLHEIDMFMGGKVTSESGDQRLIVRGIMEEAIASSQLEGAHTTRAAAKKMILEGRQPTNRSEQMILNNYKTMSVIEQNYKNEELSLELIFKMHSLLTEGTMDRSEQGRLRLDVDDIFVHGNIGTKDYTSHVPPDEVFLRREMDRLIAYANDQDGDGFLHPVVKAIFLHFWVGYLHPFVDGNGRLARALFYWYLLKKGYWMIAYLPISTIIRQAPAQYAMAYIQTEQDNLDLTYFFDFHLEKVMSAIKNFNEYLERKVSENKNLDLLLSAEMVINDRQRGLLYYLLGDDTAGTTATSHGLLNNISRQTAAADLKYLEGAGLVKSKREGQNIRYYASEKLRAYKTQL